MKGIMMLVILIALLLLVIKVSKADTIIGIINITATINSTNITIDVSGFTYNFSNAPAVISIQQNFTVYFNSTPAIYNITNQTVSSNITCNNSSISLSCSCPSFSCPNVVAGNCSIPSEINLSSSSKSDFTSAFGTQLETSSGKITQDILFKLQPTQALLDDYKSQAYNASVKQLEAERKRDEQISTNLALTGELERTRSELHMFQIIQASFILVVIISVLAYYEFFSKRQGV